MSAELPSDVLREVFKFLELPDLLNVHLSCRYFHELSDPLVYATVKLRWEDIDVISQQVILDKPDHRVKCIRKVDILPSGRGEWNSSPKLSLLMSGSNFNLWRLKVTCALRSSGWLKYLEQPMVSVTRLELVTADAFVNYAFDFEHIAYNFPSLDSISLGGPLGGFIVDTARDSRLPHLRHIRVENCSWQYPMRLADAAAEGQLETLEILATQDMHPLAFSERLQHEIATLPASLHSLTVNLDVGRRISWNPLQKSPSLPLLTSATIHGFDYKYSPSAAGAKFPRLQSLVET